jgi:hypothetical protein
LTSLGTVEVNLAIKQPACSHHPGAPRHPSSGRRGESNHKSRFTNHAVSLFDGWRLTAGVWHLSLK